MIKFFILTDMKEGSGLRYGIIGGELIHVG